MAMMRFVHVSLWPQSTSKPTAPKELSGDLTLHVTKTETGFLLFGHVREHMLELPTFQQHTHYHAKLEAIRWQAELNAEEARTLNTLLNTFSVPIMQTTMSGMDGTTYSLIFQKFQTSLALSWWVRVPEGWDKVAELMAFLYTVAERSLATTAEPLSFQERVQHYLKRFGR